MTIFPSFHCQNTSIHFKLTTGKCTCMNTNSDYLIKLSEVQKCWWFTGAKRALLLAGDSGWCKKEEQCQHYRFLALFPCIEEKKVDSEDSTLLPEFGSQLILENIFSIKLLLFFKLVFYLIFLILKNNITKLLIFIPRGDVQGLGRPLKSRLEKERFASCPYECLIPYPWVLSGLFTLEDYCLVSDIRHCRACICLQ